jgi:hypothetical protein
MESRRLKLRCVNLAAADSCLEMFAELRAGPFSQGCELARVLNFLAWLLIGLRVFQKAAHLLGKN